MYNSTVTKGMLSMIYCFKFQVGLKDLSQFLKMRPIRFFDRFIDIKGNEQALLQTTFFTNNLFYKLPLL